MAVSGPLKLGQAGRLLVTSLPPDACSGSIMAAPVADRTDDAGESEAGPGPESRPEVDPSAEPGPIVRREPTVKLQSPASGLEPLVWSDDHRISASCVNSISLLEVMCDAHSYNQDLVVHRTSIPMQDTPCVLKVGPDKEVQEEKELLACSKDPSVRQVFMLDRTMNPDRGTFQPLRGVKYTSWSPMGCDASGRCLLASLTLDGRLAVHASSRRHDWKQLVDLTEMYGQMLQEKDYNMPGAESPAVGGEQGEELRRRYHMQSAVRMEWSGVCTTQQVQSNNECKDVGAVLLAVLMENGDLAVWHFRLPFLGRESVASCSTVPSGVSSPSVLSWWEYEHSGRRMSGIIVGSAAGPVKILPVNLKAIKGYFTLRQPVVLWQEADRIPVRDIKCVSLFHPNQKCNCSLVVAARGAYLFWCLLLITKAGLNVHNSHVTGLHSSPIASLAVVRTNGSVYTCSGDGSIKKLMPVFTDAAVVFKQESVRLPERVAGRRVHGMTVSPNGAYLALLTSDGMTNGHHPVCPSYQVQFVTLKTPDEAGKELLETTVRNLFRQTDVLDLVRWKVLQEKRIPQALQEELDDKAHATGCAYLWRLKLFLYRVLYQSLQKSPAEARWRPTHEDCKVFVPNAEEEDGGGGQEEEAAAAGSSSVDGSLEEQVREILAWIEEVESHLTREHMKRVLGEVYLHTWITENTSIPTRGVCDYLASDPTNEDRAAKVLIGHILKKMNKQTFPEYCSLCKDVLPFNDRRQAVCSNGHIWLRCILTYQACQTLGYRRCLQQDSIARHPTAEDPDWIRRILQGPCTFCDSPLF